MNTISAAALAPAEMPPVTLPPSGSAPAGTSEAVNTPQPSAPISPPASVAESPVVAGTLDRKGRAFDPSKHLPKQHPNGGWMPRGGRKPKAEAAGSPPAGAAPLKQDAPFIPDEVPPPPPGETPPNAPGGHPGPQPAAQPDNSEDAGECFANGLQFATGLIFDAAADAECNPAEHRRMAATFAAYVRSKGWQAVGWVAVLLVVSAYFFRVLRRDKPAAKLKTWIHGARSETARNVTPPEKQPAPPTPKPAPPAPAPRVNALAALEVVE